MSLLESILLGILQGLTEFLPISSSGHLVLAQHFLDINEKGILLEVVLHLGTLCAILFYYYIDLKEMIKGLIDGDIKTKKYFFYLAISTFPLLCTGFIFNESVESFFVPSVVIVMLLINGILLGSTFFYLNRSTKQFSFLIALLIGFTQIFALMPGISRSGVTISIALILGIKHIEAAKFSFFLAIPGLLGAGILQILNIDVQTNVVIINLIMGFLSSALIGYFVINLLLAMLSKGRFHYFSLYCISLSIISHILLA